jgi:bacillithiol biosynthesis deacetylase BshB1
VTGPVDVLAIGAHPDDAEVGCGGTLILAVESGLRVAVADLTLGEAATRGTAEDREVERRRAAEILGLTARPMLGLPDGSLGTDPEHRMTLVQLIRELRPTVVLAPYPEDRHPDHAAAGTLVREASFLSGLPRVGEGPAHRPQHVYHYMLHHPFTPSFVIDVSSVWNRKWDAIRAHGSQFDVAGEPPGTIDVARFLEVVDARASLHGAMMGVDRAEAFHYRGPVPLTGLPGLRPADGRDQPPAGYQIFH